MEPYQVRAAPERLRSTLEAFLAAYPTTSQRVAAVQAALESPIGRYWRAELGKWTTELVPVEALVPDAYNQWRPLVRDAMEFVVSRLSSARLAPKIVEQLELPADMPAEVRLLRIITKVPGLQKIGQVLARNRHLRPEFRRALSELENSISDVSIDEIREIIFAQLGPQIARHDVQVHDEILSEATVSAVVRFTWRNPNTGRRERGVFKVLKPYIPGCFREDMTILQKLAGFLARKHRSPGFAGVAEAITEIRLLLEHEVQFRREQATLARAAAIYGGVPRVRVPRLIRPLSTNVITALSEESGGKITNAFAGQPARRQRLAQRLAEALVATPVLMTQENVIFHADPHAGNLLYDQDRDQIVVLDWALTERLSRKQRRYLILLVAMMVLRDADGVCDAIEQLRLHRHEEQAGALIRRRVEHYLKSMPLLQAPGGMAAMQLMDEIALAGVRFPAPLVMFRKATFTLQGVLEDISGSGVEMDSFILGYALTNWAASFAAAGSLLSFEDWGKLQWSALTLAPRLLWKRLAFELGAQSRGGNSARSSSPAPRRRIEPRISPASSGPALSHPPG